MRKIATLFCLLLATQLAYAKPNQSYSSQLPYKTGSITPIVARAAHLKWTKVSDYAEKATVFGDPKKTGPFVLLLKYHQGFCKSPHWHPQTAIISVISGTYYRGYGTSFSRDKAKAVELTKGTVSINPAGVYHYEWATSKNPTIIAVYGIGPWGTTYVNKMGDDISANQVNDACSNSNTTDTSDPQNTM